MPVQIDSILGSYDIFAKSIPGIVFFIGLVSLFPIDTLSSLPPVEGGGFGFITLAVLTIVVSGFIIGQALHSVAVGVESVSYKLAKYIYQRIPYLTTNYWLSRKGFSKKIKHTADSRGPYYSFFVHKISSVIKMPSRIYCWFVNRVREVVLPHRLWFKRRLRNEFNKDDPDGLYEWFKIEIRDHLQSMNMDLYENHEKVYRHVMSYLAFVKGGRARKFQATSSFCRSMWITFLLFAIVYSILLRTSPTGILEESIIHSVLLEYHYWLPLSLAVSSILFMYSAGRYKKHFTEYIIYDFYNTSEMNINNTG